MNQGTNLPMNAQVLVAELSPEIPNGLKVVGDAGISVTVVNKNLGTEQEPLMKDVFQISQSSAGQLPRMLHMKHKFTAGLKLPNQIQAEKLFCALDTTNFTPAQYPYINLELPDLHADDHGKEIIVFLQHFDGVGVNVLLPQPIAGTQEFLLLGLGSSMRFTCVCNFFRQE